MSVYDDMIEISKIGEDTDRKLRAERMERERKRHARNLRIRKNAIIILISGAALVGAVGAYSKYENKPIRVVTTELMTDAGFKRTGDGRRIDDKMTEEELVDYIKSYNLSEEEIRASVIKDLKYEGISVEFGMDKVEKANPKVFNNDSINEENKSMGRS